MKKIVYMIFSLIIVLLIALFNPLLSQATTSATVYLEANRVNIEKGERIEVSFHIKDQKTAAYLANIYFDETKFKWISGPDNISVQGNRINILWYDEQGGSGAKQGEIGKVVLEAKEEGLANFIIDGEFFTEDGQLIQSNFEALQVQIGKEETKLEMQTKQEQENDKEISNANLQDMRINEEGIVPEFQKDIHQYDLTIPNDINNIEVLAIAENPNAQVEITGNTRIKRRIKLNKNKGNF